MATVVVTGVSGSVGRRLASLLAGRDDVERVIGLDVVPVGWSHPKFEAHQLDLAGADLKSALHGATAVIHTAWRTADARLVVAQDEAAIAAANLRALRHVLDAVADTRPEQLVHLSSATVYGAWPDNQIPLTEDAQLRPNPEFPFAATKAEAERILAEWSEDHPDVAVTVLRPAVTVGPNERPLYQALGGTRAPRSGDGSRPVQYLHVDDLAASVVLAWEQCLTGVYNVAPDGGIPEDEAAALAGGVAKVTLPARVAAQVSAWAWTLWRKGVPLEAQAYATHPWVVAPDRLKAAGWVPQYSSAEALVVTDPRAHWDDLPPGRRQNYNLVIILVALAGVVAGLGAAVNALRRRS